MRSPAKKTKDRKRSHRGKKGAVQVDIRSLLSIENTCPGCSPNEQSCCSTYDVCITAAEMERIIRYLPDAAEYCPHLRTEGGYDNIFEEEERGFYTLDTHEDGLCVLAYWVDGRTQCSLHTIAKSRGLALAAIKPKCCLLWPLRFSEINELLNVVDEAAEFRCNTRKRPGSRVISPSFIGSIELVYGKGCGTQVQLAAEQGERTTFLAPRRNGHRIK